MQVLPHLESCMFPAAEQKPETATGRRGKKTLLSPQDCLDKPTFLLHHPFPSQALGLLARRLRGSQLCLQFHSHTHTPLAGQRSRGAGRHRHSTPRQGHPVSPTRSRECHHHDRNLLHSLQFSPWVDELTPAALPQVVGTLRQPKLPIMYPSGARMTAPDPDWVCTSS